MKYAIFSYTTPNLGDDVQAIAAGLVLPSVDAFVDRDRLDQVSLSEPHLLLMNSWFAVGRYRATPSTTILPIYYGMCAGRPEMLNDDWMKEWEKHQPIGCRDQHTVQLLRSRGLSAHFTSCITSFMGRFVAKPRKREGIYFVDVPATMERFIPEGIRHRAVRITNEFSPRAVTPKERFRKAAVVLDKLRTAELVVTRRLHAALPCIGFETPVSVYLQDHEKNRQRFSGLEDYVPIVLHDGREPIDASSWKEPRVISVPANVDGHFADLLLRLGQRSIVRYDSISAFVETLPDASLLPLSWYRSLVNVMSS